VVHKISQKEFGAGASLIEQILGKGKVNQVFKVVINDTQYIFRFNKKEYLNFYQKEWYCINLAQEAGIPTSEVYFVGIEGEFAYMILDYIEGNNGLDVSEDEHAEIYKTLGIYTKKLEAIKVSGFGRNVITEKDGFYEDWQTFLNESREKIFDDGILIKKEILSKEQTQQIQNRLKEMENWNFEPKLCHGNMHVSNAIISPEGKVYLIDWGNGAGHKSPHVDLADLIAWKDRKYINSFLEGLDMSEEEFTTIEHDVNTLLIMQLLDVIKRAVDTGKEFDNNEFISNSVERILQLK
jgi:fructosamine-3-kinase